MKYKKKKFKKYKKNCMFDFAITQMLLEKSRKNRHDITLSSSSAHGIPALSPQASQL